MILIKFFIIEFIKSVIIEGNLDIEPQKQIFDQFFDLFAVKSDFFRNFVIPI